MMVVLCVPIVSVSSQIVLNIVVTLFYCLSEELSHNWPGLQCVSINVSLQTMSLTLSSKGIIFVHSVKISFLISKYT